MQGQVSVSKTDLEEHTDRWSQVFFFHPGNMMQQSESGLQDDFESFQLLFEPDHMKPSLFDDVCHKWLMWGISHGIYLTGGLLWCSSALRLGQVHRGLTACFSPLCDYRNSKANFRNQRALNSSGSYFESISILTVVSNPEGNNWSSL